MQVGKFWVITTSTIKGKWHVGSYQNYWYVVNIQNGKSKKIGPFRMRGTNYFDKAKEEAIRRNSL